MLTPWRFLGVLISRGEAKFIAPYLKLHPQTITNWQNEPNTNHANASGRRSPLDHIRQLFKAFRDLDGDDERCHQIAEYVSTMAGGVHCPLPDCDDPRISDSDVTKLLSDIFKEVGEATEAVNTAWFIKSPGEFTAKEKEKVTRELMDVVRASMRGIKVIERL